MNPAKPHSAHHHPAEEPDDLEPGLLPVEPDLGPVPPGAAGDGKDDGVNDAEV